MIAAILVMLASLLGCSIAVEAHQINLTNARIVISPDRIVEVEIAIKGSDADRVAGTRVAAPVCFSSIAIWRSWRCGSGRRPPRETSCMRYATARISSSRLRCGEASVL